MENISEIIDRGSADAGASEWVNMRHAWSANDARRDAGLVYPKRIIQIKNLDYKEKPDKCRLDEAMTAALLADADRPTVMYRDGMCRAAKQVGKTDGADGMDGAELLSVSDTDAPQYATNSLLDIYFPCDIPTDDIRRKNTASWPVIVSVHGGGWFYGDKELYSHYCADLARRGYAVVNFNYRLSPENKYPAAIEDVSYCIKFISENARALHLDMDRFFMAGDSAGAQLAANYCIIATNEAYRRQLDFFTYDRPPRAVCLNCGAYDMDGRDDMIYGWYLRRADGSYAVDGRQLELFRTQLDYMTMAFPPSYLMYSVNDNLAPHTVELAKRMNAVGVVHTIRPYGQKNSDSGHVFHLDLHNSESAECNDEECAFLRTWDV